MRVAVWTPLPPQRSGVADYAYELLAEMSRHVDLVAVVRDGSSDAAVAPEGVQVVARSEYDARATDIDIYHFGNSARFHGYMYQSIIARPGMLVLHDPALPDFHWDLCGGFDSSLFQEEARFDAPELESEVPVRYVGGHVEVDWLRAPLSRRVVEASRLTVVHSASAGHDLARHVPDAAVVHCDLASKVIEATAAKDRTSAVTFGVLGGISRPKRIAQVLEAFKRAHRADGSLRLVIAGRNDQPELVDELRRKVADNALESAVTINCDVPAPELAELLRLCDAVVALRWPTVGETSAPLMAALGAGRMVITSDVPQVREISSTFCLRVPTGGPDEIPEITARMLEVAADPAAARRAGDAAREFVRGQATFDIVAEKHVALARGVANSAVRCVPRHLRPRSHLEVNAIGSWQSVSGVAEAARRVVGAMLEAGVSVALEDIDFGYPKDSRRMSDRLRTLPSGRPHATEICFLNINEMNVLPTKYFRSRVRDHYVAANWYWELPRFPPHLRAEIGAVDEIWAPSNFTADSFRNASDVPVYVLPCVVEPIVDTSVERADLGIPDDRFMYLFSFDARSTLARKNPFAVIEAFRRAFTPRERATDVVLVFKTHGLGEHLEGDYMIRHALETVGGVLLDDELSPGHMGALTACCDAYVSLHRTEGFGLGMAEAMRLGRPVIATGYSGNCDYMTLENSCLVGYRMSTIDEGELRFNPASKSVYTPGEPWADPDVDEAAHWMRVLYEHPSLCERVGIAAEQTMRRRYSAAAAGTAFRERLEEIG
ncbi:MAG: glycosyltransferase [Acidimicrobiaceae bacterium]|nr:glycosyltransferase [Acidimicrobiaceae bacterium]